MGRKRSSGLYLRGGVWHIDKQYRGQRICESTGTSRLQEAEEVLIHRLEACRRVAVFGERPMRSFRSAATKYLTENQHKRSIGDYAYHISLLDPFIGGLSLQAVHNDSLHSFVEARKKDGVKNRTINFALEAVRRILRLAAEEWRDDNGLTWLPAAPKITLLPEDDARDPYPLSWEEQQRFFAELPPHLARMALFKVNTGCREQEVCGLRWDWEVAVPELATSVFIIPKDVVKNREDRLVVLNSVALSVCETVRGEHSEYVFTYRGRPVGKMNNSAWKRARRVTDLPLRVHDLKHTFGRRLRAAGIGFEDRQDLLGHKSGRVTTHYSAAELENLLEAAEQACRGQSRKSPALVVLKRRALHSGSASG